jgi:acyl dehydratase
VSRRYYDDYRAGEVVHAPGVTLSEADILDFALRYDPQPLHLDALAAARSSYGGLIASGWHVAALGFRMLIQAGLLGEGSLGSPGLDELRWHLPARPGDTLYAEAEVLDVRPSASKPDRGVVIVAYRIKNQHGQVIMSCRGVQLVRRG